jgi:inorganic pyrophosphatase
VFWMHDEHGPDAKILTVPAADPRYHDVRDLSDVPAAARAEISQFFDVYKALERQEQPRPGMAAPGRRRT